MEYTCLNEQLKHYDHEQILDLMNEIDYIIIQKTEQNGELRLTLPENYLYNQKVQLENQFFRCFDLEERKQLKIGNYIFFKENNETEEDLPNKQLLIKQENIKNGKQIAEREAVENQIRQKTKKIYQKLLEKLKEIEQRYEGQVFKEWFQAQKKVQAPNNKLSFDTIQKIKVELEKKHENRNYYMLDKSIHNLEYFKEFSKGIRYNLLENCEFKVFNQHDIIYNQGDIGDKFYVILSGSVDIRYTRCLGYDLLSYIVNSKYDGQQFGEFSMLSACMNKYEEKENSDFLILTKQEEKLKRKKQYNKDLGLDEIFGDEDLIEEYFRDLDDYVGSDRYYFDLRRKAEIFNELFQKDVGKLKGKKLRDMNNIDNWIYGEDEMYQDIIQRQKREASVIAAERTYLLCWDRVFYSNLMNTYKSAEMEKKMKVLMQLQCFKNVEAQIVLPLAQLLQIKKYNMNEFIYKVGQEVNFFGIILEGISSVIQIQKKQTNLNQLIEKPHPLYFNYKNPCDKTCKINPQKGQRRTRQDKLKELKTIYKNYDIITPSEKFKAGQKNDPENYQLQYTEHLKLKNLAQGEYFGGRCLLTQEDIIEKQKRFPEFKFEGQDLQKAQFSLIAISPEVQVMEINPDQIQDLPEDLQQLLRQEIIEYKEFDQIDEEFLQKMIKQNKTSLQY
ncbi:Cyclic nucleotide-binding protein [Pseudocohnilembus persalinus]|uniref:Cyclic nucleotide-binding protein n=1 Tax=Pseudocohnilembus persalinus TaxID=266149 RepID=A0A0V0Q917_PSEPJ|nr:Cyclic nucleotide-binding protein [Pseudocohnilembus persalinus]|eukprot:KRW98702.1 Cyclic nucleotide-binding protein [Pseudocohnilembus persalinus]